MFFIDVFDMQVNTISTFYFFNNNIVIECTKIENEFF